MNKTIKVAAALSAAGVLALTGCSSDSSSDSGDSVNVVGYSVLQQANEGVISAFNDTDAGKDVDVKGSYGASGDQSRAVAAGQDADEVHLSLEPDVTRLVDEGIVADDWKDNDTKGICTQSIVVMVVKSGNPDGIDSWDDLAKPGVGIVTPNPASSGSAKWNLLAAYGSVLASGTGDVLLSYENEAILARQSGTDFDYVIPDSSLLIENPCALTDGASDSAQAFMDFQKSADGQKLYAETGYRPLVDVGDVDVEGANDPSDPFPVPATLLTIDKDFGGWSEANDKYFGDGEEGNPLGILTQIQADAGQ